MADAQRITDQLLKHYEPTLALHFTNPFELLIAVILAAQCTDERVNQVTQGLFKHYKHPQDFVEANPEALQKALRPTGFYKSKTDKVIKCCKRLLEDFGGRVPDNIDDLSQLPGVGRKTANMILGNAFNQQTIAVDTHVLRVANRLGLAQSNKAARVEQTLLAQVPADKRTAFTNTMVRHGRAICTARKPKCCDCVLYNECGWYNKPEC